MRVIEAKGSHAEIGEQIGEQCWSIAQKLRTQFQQTWKRKGADPEAVIMHAQKFLPYAEAFYMPYSTELRFYARRVNIPFDEVFAWFCGPPAPKGCTDLVFNQRATADGGVYMLHNEDYDLAEAEYAVLVKMYPKDAPAFMAMTYGGIWFNAGVNECGIGIAGTGLAHTDSRIGIPADFSFRKMLSARTIGEAMEYSTPENRSNSYCNIICDESGEMYAMEGSATDFAALHGREVLAHSNHYLAPRMEKYDAGFQGKEARSPRDYSDSIVRYNRALNIALDRMPIERQDMETIAGDHVNRPWSICRHIDESLAPELRSKTLFSEIIDVSDRSIWLCEGNPCENHYNLHEL